MKIIEARRVQTNRFLKYLVVGNFFAFLIFFAFIAIFSYMSDNVSMSFNERPLGELEGFLYVPLFALIGGVMSGIMTWISITLGFWGWAKFKPLVIEYEPYEESEENL